MCVFEIWFLRKRNFCETSTTKRHRPYIQIIFRFSIFLNVDTLLAVDTYFVFPRYYTVHRFPRFHSNLGRHSPRKILHRPFESYVKWCYMDKVQFCNVVENASSMALSVVTRSVPCSRPMIGCSSHSCPSSGLQ